MTMLVPEPAAVSGTGMVSRLAQWIVAARVVPLTGTLREAALRCLLDLLGATAAGLNDPGARAVRQVAPGGFGPGRSPLWFTGAQASPVAAAWANAAAAAAQDLDDGNRMARGHPGAAVIPAVLAVGTDLGCGVERMLTAIAIGYEVGVTIGTARTTYGNTGTWSAYAVVAAAAALRGTPVDQIEHALAIAGESAPNQLFASAPAPRTPDPEGSHVKEGIPWSVVTGLLALNLAEAGHSGPRNILESTRHYRFDRGLRLGQVPRIGQTYFKLYACCRHVHAPLDALQAVLACHGIAAAEIDRIEVRTTSGALRISNLVAPQNLTDLQYSIPYCLALVALAGPQTLLPLAPAALQQPGAQQLAARVNLVLDPDIDARFPAETLAQVAVHARGQWFNSAVTGPRGDAAAPLSWDELEAKYLQAGAANVAAERLFAVLDALRRLRDGRDDALPGLQ